MLDLLRKNSRSFIIYLLFAIIILVFVFTFGAITPDQACSGQSGPGQIADLVSVNGDPIDTHSLNMVAALSASAPSPSSTSDAAQQARRTYLVTRYWRMGLVGPFSGARFGRDPIDVSPIAIEKYLDEIVETKLVSDYARELGMTITNEEMSDRLALLTEQFKDPETGAFDPDAWSRFVTRQLGTSPVIFEYFVKNELLRERVIALLVGAVAATDQEIAQRHKLLKEQAKLEYVTVDKTSARPLVTIDKAELAKWIGENETKIAEAYDAQVARFTTEAKWTARVVQLTAPSEADGVDDDQKKAFAEERTAVKAKAEQLRKDAAAAIAAAKAAPAPAPTPEDGEAPVAAPVAISAADAVGAIAKASSDHASAEAGGLLGPAGLSVYSQSFGGGLRDAIEGSDAGSLTDVVEVNGGFAFAYVEATSPEIVKPVDAVREDLGRELMQAEGVEAILDEVAAKVLAEAKKDPTKSLADAAKAVNAAYGLDEDASGLRSAETLPFSRVQDFGGLSVGYVFGIGQSAEIVRAAFAATEDSPLLDGVFTIESDGKRVVARLIDKPELAELSDEDKTSLAEELTFLKQRAVYRGWYDALVEAKLKAGDIAYSGAWAELKRQAREAFTSSGGKLKDVQPKTAAATPAPADAEAETEAKPQVEAKPVAN